MRTTLALLCSIGLSASIRCEELMVSEEDLDEGTLISYIDSSIHSKWDLNDENARDADMSPVVAVRAAKEFVKKNLKSIESYAVRAQLRGDIIQDKSYWYWGIMFIHKDKGITLQVPRSTWIRVSRDGKVMARLVPTGTDKGN